MRLNRAILLNHLKEIVENGKRLTPEQLKALAGANHNNAAEELGYDLPKASNQANSQPANMDEDTDGTEEEDIAEVSALPPTQSQRPSNRSKKPPAPPTPVTTTNHPKKED